MMDLTREDVGRLRELLGKATPGPWREDAKSDILRIEGGSGSFVGACRSVFVDQAETEANQALIIAAANNLPALLDIAERYLGMREAGYRVVDDEACQLALYAQLTEAEAEAAKLPSPRIETLWRGREPDHDPAAAVRRAEDA